METKIILSLLCLALFSCQSCAQKGEPITVKKLKKELRSYLESEKQLTAGESAIIYIVDLADYQEYKQGAGICKFGILGSHQLPFLVLVSETEIKIIRDYKTKFVLESFAEFIQERDNHYTEIQKSLLLKNVSDVLYSRMKMMEDSSIKEE
jgi:hypothetical protein